MNVCGKQFTITPSAGTRLRIVGYADGLFTTGSGSNSLDAHLTGNFTDLFTDVPIFGWGLLASGVWSVPGGGGTGRSSVADPGVSNGVYGAQFGFPGRFSLELNFATNGGGVNWVGIGPVDPGWNGISAPNIASAVGVYNHIVYPFGPDLALPASVTIELY